MHFTVDPNQTPGQYDDCPPEHREAYAEMVHQFQTIALKAYREALSTTIMRELPPSLQMNALVVGFSTGGLTPLLMMSKPDGDAAIATHLAASAPMIVAAARKLASAVWRNGR